MRRRVVEMMEHSLERIAQPLRLRHQRAQIRLREVNQLHELRLEASMHPRISRVALRIRPLPAIVVNRVVQGLSSVGGVMPEPSRVKRYVLLDELRILL